MDITKETVEKFFNSLVSKKIITKDDILFDNDSIFDFNVQSMLKLVEKGSPIRIDKSGIHLEYLKSSEDGVELWEPCPSMEDGIEKCSIFLSDRIPPFVFTTDESNSTVANNEIEAIYTCSIVAGVFRDEFLEEYKHTLENYDFSKVTTGNDANRSFTYLLNEWKSLQSRQVQAVCSACKENITSKKEQFSSLNLSLLDKEGRIKLRDLKTEISIYFNDFKRERLNESATEGLLKHEMYKLYHERDTYIKEQIIMSNKYASVRTLYFIDRLNFEDVSPLVKKRIVTIAKQEVRDYFEGKDVSSAVRDELKNKLLRKGIKVFLRKWKNEEMEKYLSNRDEYKLPNF